MKRRCLSRWVLAVGVALLLLFLVPFALRYPWGMLVGDTSPLPDPDPLPDMVEAPGEGMRAEPQILPAQADSAETGTVLQLEAVGVIKIPKIRLSENIVEGVGDLLYYGVGHLPGTPLPGMPGNCVLTGHRNYIRMCPFRYLDRLETGDAIEITAGGELYLYRVYDTAVVTPADTWVIQPQEGYPHALTLITCTPVIGMQNRLIVWAEPQT